MKLTYHFNLASLSKRQLNAHLRQLFNALSSADDVNGHRQEAKAIDLHTK